MTWKEWLEQEGCNTDCPYYKADICKMQGMSCYGGAPIEPPCASASFPDDKEIDEIVCELLAGIRRYEEHEDELLAAKRTKEKRAKKAADTRRRMRSYCAAEIVRIKTLKKQIAAVEKIKSVAESLAFAVNTTNEMFKYKERVKPKCQYQTEIDRLQAELSGAEFAYKEKRKEFYRKDGTQPQREDV